MADIKESRTGNWTSATSSFYFLLVLDVCLISALLVFYWPLLVDLMKRLWKNDDYSYGLLLPVVSGYIAYLKWPQIRKLTLAPSWSGLGLLAAGLLIYFLGILSTDLYSPTLSFVISLGGVLFTAGGWGLLRVLLFPLILMVFMIPLPQFLTQKLTLPLQLVSSRLATVFLHMVGVPAVRQGNIIDLGVRQLQVVAACSGLRYILALLALGLIFCYFYQRRPWKAGLLMVSVIPAAIFANALRVAGMGLYPQLQEGFWHGFTGWLIFIFCFACLMGLNRLLTWGQVSGPGDPDPEAGAVAAANAPSRPGAAPLLIGLAMILAVGYLALRLGDIPPVPLKRPLAEFPMQLGEWRGRASAIDPVMFKATGASTYLNADYVDGQGNTINLWIAYYENQRGGGSVHSPFSCLTGSGWSLIKEETTEITPGRPVKVMLMEQAGQRYLVYYWYLQRGRWLASEYWNKLLLSYDGLTRRRTDGALVRLITPVSPEAALAQTRLNSFTNYLIPELPFFMKE